MCHRSNTALITGFATCDGMSASPYMPLKTAILLSLMTTSLQSYIYRYSFVINVTYTPIWLSLCVALQQRDGLMAPNVSAFREMNSANGWWTAHHGSLR